METYEFNYVTQSAKMSIENNILNFKIALRKGTINFEDLVYFRKFEYQDYDQLIIRFRNKEGKEQNIKAFAEKGSQGLNAFLFRLGELFPQKDLSKTPAQEARKMLKSGHAAKGGMIGAIIILVAVLAFIFRGVFKDIQHNMPLIIILAIVVLILVGAFVFIYFKGKNESKDW